jgi:hypothetical protein
MSRAGILAVALGAALAAAAPAAGEAVKVDAVGVAPAGPGARQAALDSGLREAVLLVAGELAREGGASVGDRDVLAGALGPDLRSYAIQYELLEDRGERPAQLVQEPGVEREYAVVVQVQVERARVSEALRRAGLLGAPSPGGVRSLWLTLEGVHAWRTWERVQRALAARGGSVRPIEFARGVVIAEMQTEESNEALVARLRRALGESLGLSVLGSAPGTLRLRVVAGAAPTLDVPDTAAPAAPIAPTSP